MNTIAKKLQTLKTSSTSRKIIEIFSLDPRSLALLRISLGLLIIVDLIQRSRYLEAHYTDVGVFPRWIITQHYAPIDTFSFHLLSGNFWFMAALFIINGFFALMLLLGWKTKLMNTLCWFFLISLQNRNNQILQGGDVLFRMILLWGIFLPLGRFWSIDARNNKEIPSKAAVFSSASIAYISQILVLYITAGMYKIADPWMTDLDGVYRALNADHFATSFAPVLLQYPELLKFLSLFTLYCELALPFALICPLFFQYTRFFAVSMLISMHIGFSFGLSVGLFWIIDIISILALIPPITWQHLESLSIYSVVGEFREIMFEHFIKLALRIRKLLSSRTLIKFSSTSFLLGSTLYIIAWVAPSYPGVEFSMPSSWQWYGRLLGMEQSWQMFSPYPMSDDGWWVVVGKLKDGTEVDVLERKVGPVSLEKPKLLYKTMVTDRWRKYFRNLLIYKEKYPMLYFAKGLCRNWNLDEKRDEKKLNSFEIFYMLEQTVPDYKKPEVQKQLKWQHFCFEVPKEHKKKSKDK